MRQLILASSSPWRRELLGRLQLPFISISPGIDETPLPGEKPEALAVRLSRAKADAIALLHPDALVLGSDQVAELDGQILGKPGSHQRAVTQLQASSGRCVNFFTAMTLSRHSGEGSQTELVLSRVFFRDLTLAQIEGYLRKEPSWDTAGSFKAEGLGISLFSRIESDDPTALIGLPLIRLVAMLEREGVAVL
jgi:septum formation protein